MHAERPAIDDVRSGAELRRWYWVKAELVELARHRGVRASGSKPELTDRLAAALDGIADPSPPRARRPGGTQLAGVLDSDTVIPAGQRSSQALRGFFEGAIGPSFRFDAAMRQFVEEGAGRTLGDAVDHWYATRDRPCADIAPQFELNRFVRAWHERHPGGSRAEALEAWRRHRSLPTDARD